MFPKWIKKWLWGLETPYDPKKPLIVRVKPSFFEMRNKDDWSNSPLQPLTKHDVTNKELDAIFQPYYGKYNKNHSMYQYLFDIMPDDSNKWKNYKPLWIANVTKKNAKNGVVEWRITYTKDDKTYKENKETQPFDYIEGLSKYQFYEGFHKHFFAGDEVIVRKANKKKHTKAIYAGILDASQIQVTQ